MNSILNNLDPKEKVNFLAALVKAILPEPSVSRAIEPVPISEELLNKVLSEIRARLKLDQLDHSSLAHSKIYDFLTSEMRKNTLMPTQTHLIKQRVGQKGLLPPALYNIKFTDVFSDTSFKRGVSRAEVRQTLEEPSLVEHLSPRDDLDKNTEGMSFYTRGFEGPRQGDRYTLLVRTTRKGYEQSVYSAWRIYYSDVRIQDTGSPLDFLKAFIDVYGMPFRIGQSGLTKFLLYDAILALPNQSYTQILRADNPHNHGLEMTAGVRINKLGVIEVAVAFCIDVTIYIDALKSHGVEVKA